MDHPATHTAAPDADLASSLRAAAVGNDPTAAAPTFSLAVDSAGPAATTAQVAAGAALPAALDRVVSTSVHHVETNGQEYKPPYVILLDQPGVDTDFRHRGWDRNRRLIADALHRASVSDDRMRRFCTCGDAAWVVQDPSDSDIYRVQANYCRDRFCLPCSQTRSRLIAANLADKIQQGKYRFITLTLKTGQEPLTESLDRLYDCFRRLRRRRLWQACIIGGVAFTEVNYNAETNRWHPHLHIVAQGSYMPQKLLSQDWHVVTGDSYVVDVRMINDSDKAVAYVTKYASKPLSNTYLNRPDRLDEAIRALSGRRLVTAFGSWRGWQLLRKPHAEPWITVGPLDQILWRAAKGSDQDIIIVESIRRTYQCRTTQNRSPP